MAAVALAAIPGCGNSAQQIPPTTGVAPASAPSGGDILACLRHRGLNAAFSPPNGSEIAAIVVDPGRASQVALTIFADAAGAKRYAAESNIYVKQSGTASRASVLAATAVELHGPRASQADLKAIEGCAAS